MGSDHKHRVCTYFEAEQAIKNNEVIFLNECFCRGPARDGKAAWEYCGHTVETCMGFHPPGEDDEPYSYREINKKDALGLFKAWKEQNLFFRFLEDERWICFCCPCGCGFFRDEKGRITEDHCDKGLYIERTDVDACILCGDCIDVCPYGARSIEENTLKIISKKCYGCSVCEYVCPEQAISMIERKES